MLVKGVSVGMVKRLFDIFSALSAGLLLFPLLLLTYLIVMVSLGRPVLFKQQRPGLNEIPFTLYKFRTMKMDTDGNNQLLPDEQRMSRVGKVLRKYSLDELPQLWNVLIGDISFVGPRPLLMDYLSLYSDEQRRRHDVRPGLTGWAQIHGRNDVSWSEKFKLDVWYVDNQSFLLDLIIIWKTLIIVVAGMGTNQAGHVTVERFTGNVERS